MSDDEMMARFFASYVSPRERPRVRCEYEGNEVECAGSVEMHFEPLHLAYDAAPIPMCEAHLAASHRLYDEQVGWCL